MLAMTMRNLEFSYQYIFHRFNVRPSLVSILKLPRLDAPSKIFREALFEIKENHQLFQDAIQKVSHSEGLRLLKYLAQVVLVLPFFYSWYEWDFKLWYTWCIDRQTDILLTEKKSHYRLICHRNERDICTCIYKIVSLLKSYDNIHGMTYTTKIMLSGIAKIKTGYFDNINDYY